MRPGSARWPTGCRSWNSALGSAGGEAGGVATDHHVGAVSAVDRVRALPAHQHVAAVEAEPHLLLHLGRAEVDQHGAYVAARSTHQGVVAVATHGAVGTRATLRPGRSPEPPTQVVAAGATVEDVLVVATVEAVVAESGRQGVGAGASAEAVGTVTGDEQVGAGTTRRPSRAW